VRALQADGLHWGACKPNHFFVHFCLFGSSLSSSFFFSSFFLFSFLSSSLLSPEKIRLDNWPYR
jgi:hypothetical protein